MAAVRRLASMGPVSEHVVIVGGGVGALEGLLALQSLAGDRTRISVLTAGRHLTYRALSVAEPFGADPVPHYDWEAITQDRGVRWIPDTLVAVRPDQREIDTRDGPPVPYDALLLALGATPEPVLPGAISFGGPRDVFAVMEAIESLAPGRRRAIAFVATAGTAWTLPLYELALLTAESARARGLDVAIEVVTREDQPLGVFGAQASAEVARGSRTRASTYGPGRSRKRSPAASCIWSSRAHSTWISSSRFRGCVGRPSAVCLTTRADSCRSTPTVACGESTACGPWAT
jgi:hypothetical protein